MRTFFTILAFIITILCIPTVIHELTDATEVMTKIVQASLGFAGSVKSIRIAQHNKNYDKSLLISNITTKREISIIQHKNWLATTNSKKLTWFKSCGAVESIKYDQTNWFTVRFVLI